MSALRHRHVLLLLVNLALLAAPVVGSRSEAADAWIFSGQSNMQKIGSAAQKAVGEVVARQEHEYHPIFVAAPGKPIEAWLDPKHRDYKLWTALEEEVAQAKQDGHTFQGFVWYQGEANVNERAGQYQRQLAELVARIRKLTGEPKLPVIVVQIASATTYSGRDWACATVREAQRRFAQGDDNAAVVAAIDAEIGDYTVHLSNDGVQTVVARVAAAAERLAYGNAHAHWGPQFAQAYFADQHHQAVVVQFAEVQDDLKLSDGWLAGFGASEKTSLAESLAELADATKLGDLPSDFIYPVGGKAIGDGRLVLWFEKPLAEDARLSYAAPRNAQYGPHRRWQLEFTGVRDASGHQTPAFVLVPIGKPRGKLDAADIEFEKREKTPPWQQLAVNCIGRFAAAVTLPDAEAGIAADHWRQAYWNPASAGRVPNLFDHRGNVSPVSFHTGVWYMSPYFKELNSGDDALMASWCKHNLHAFSGLEPGAKYDVAIYLLQGPPRNSEATPTHRGVRVTVLDTPSGKPARLGKVVAQQTVQVPADGKFTEYQLATKANEFRGNVLLLENISATDAGRIEFTVEISETKGEKIRWSDTTLAGVQLRVAQ